MQSTDRALVLKLFKYQTSSGDFLVMIIQLKGVLINDKEYPLVAYRSVSYTVVMAMMTASSI